MAKLSEIAQAIILLSTATIARANFGIPMVVANTTAFPERVRIYTDMAAVVVDKLEQDVIDALRLAFSQTPRPEKVMVGRISPSSAKVSLDSTKFTGTGTPTAPAATVFSVAVNSFPVSYTVATGGEAVPAVTAGLIAAFKAISDLDNAYTVTADNAATPPTLTITPKLADTAAPSLTTFQNTAAVVVPIAASEIQAQLDAINGENNTWYGFSVIGAPDDMIELSAAWAESAEPPKQYFANTDTPAVWSAASTTDVLSKLKAKQYLRTSVIVTKDRTEADEVAAMARFYVGQPGQIVMGLKTLVGVTPSEFNPTQHAAILAKNGNTYEQYADNVYLLNPGKVVSGEWADTVRDRDYLIDDIQKAMAAALIRNPKLPYTNPGITVLANVLTGRLRAAQQQGILSPDQRNSAGDTVPGFVITVPNAVDIDADTRAGRTLKMSFVALLAGAIQMVRVDGVLTYAYGETVTGGTTV